MITYNYLLIPIILFFIGLEYIIALKNGKGHFFKFESSLSNLSIGIWERFCYLFSAGLFYQLFVWIYENYSFISIPSNFGTWIVLLLSTDFVWYWYHRMGHEVNLFWGAHVVHHQSEEFNLTAASRITLLQSLVRTVFWCVLPLVGFHPDRVVSILLIHGAYSFFTHTQMVGKLGFLELIFITPSHHRVHHASNPEYLDKNYGDIFVFWDKLFGTFKEEQSTIVFGLVKPFESHSFLWSHFHFYVELLEALKEEVSWIKRIKMIFGKPDLIKPEYIEQARSKFKISPSTQTLNQNAIIYLIIQMTFVLGGLILITKTFSGISVSLSWFLGGIILITLINIGALIEQKTWVFYLEFFRLFLIASAIILGNDLNLSLMPGILLGLAALSLTSFKSLYNSLFFLKI